MYTSPLFNLGAWNALDGTAGTVGAALARTPGTVGTLPAGIAKSASASDECAPPAYPSAADRAACGSLALGTDGFVCGAVRFGLDM